MTSHSLPLKSNPRVCCVNMLLWVLFFLFPSLHPPKKSGKRHEPTMSYMWPLTRDPVTRCVRGSHNFSHSRTKSNHLSALFRSYITSTTPSHIKHFNEMTRGTIVDSNTVQTAAARTRQDLEAAAALLQLRRNIGPGGQGIPAVPSTSSLARLAKGENNRIKPEAEEASRQAEKSGTSLGPLSVHSQGRTRVDTHHRELAPSTPSTRPPPTLAQTRMPQPHCSRCERAVVRGVQNPLKSGRRAALDDSEGKGGRA